MARRTGMKSVCSAREALDSRREKGHAATDRQNGELPPLDEPPHGRPAMTSADPGCLRWPLLEYLVFYSPDWPS